MARMNKRYGSGIKTGRKGEDKGRREGGIPEGGIEGD